MNVTDRAIAASVGGDVAKLVLLLNSGVSVSTETDGGSSLLSLAISNGKTDVVRLLLERGANAHGPETNGFSPLELAICRADTNITGVLIDHGASPEDKTYGHSRPVGAQGCYGIALENNQPHQVTFLEGRGWEPFDVRNGRGLFYQLLLHLPRNYAAIDFLIARGAEPMRGMWWIPDIYDRLIAGGRTIPPDVLKWRDFSYAPQPMTPLHPFWKIGQAIGGLQPNERIRAATNRELAGFASHGVAASVLEFFAHFLITKREAIFTFNNYDGMMLDNSDSYPALSQRGYFIIGGEGSGDIFAVGREIVPGHALPPVFRVDHERYNDDSAAANLPNSLERIADDLIEFIEPLIPTPKSTEGKSEELISTRRCSRCDSMESWVLGGKEAPYRYCLACEKTDPFTG